MLDTINIEDIKSIALSAGEAVMKIYAQEFDVEYKDDKSPLTKADLIANKMICDALKKAYPSIPIMSEENKEVPFEVRKNWTYYWCIDPIDGTKEFIKKNDEFTLNIALIQKDTPVLGVVHAPALGELFYAKKGEGAYLQMLHADGTKAEQKRLPLRINEDTQSSLSVVASKSHLSSETQAFIDDLAAQTKEVTLLSKGSSLKLCMVASGEADVYPRLAPTSEWDTAAADAVVREAGKMSYRLETQTPLIYNKENLLNPWFVAR